MEIAIEILTFVFIALTVVRIGKPKDKLDYCVVTAGIFCILAMLAKIVTKGL